ncbi:MAG: hypothetical protein EPN26_15900 [Rhodospirillales bacterium]|nr:MAG: hypothetical protein EPN26_15900 [Rhodospirillales bacterium]
MRQKSIRALALLGAGFLLLGFSFVDAARMEAKALPRLAVTAGMAERLGLSDLVLFTEARYTRHLALADRFAAFQDYPMAFEHFPSGSIAPPPRHLVPGR